MKPGTTHAWQKTITGLSALGLIELLLAYGFASWAIDSGRLLAYFLTLVLLGSAATNFTRVIRKSFRGAEG